ncbi:MAG: DNA-3-methyladenine glycosylase [Candidatus Dormibacteria bacterium]
MARDLLGRRLRADPGTSLMVTARVVEVEAYLGRTDPASHAFAGPSPRAATMFGPAGRLYVYLSYGIHHCANLVTEPDGTPGAVLLRAAEVEEGEAVVRERRGAGLPSRDLLRGPGNLCRGLGLSRADNGLPVAGGRSRLQLLAGRAVPDAQVRLGPRVGISRAAELPLRLWVDGDPAVSGRAASGGQARTP